MNIQCLPSELIYEQLRIKPFIIAGPCVLESFDLAMTVAKEIAVVAKDTNLFAIFKSSYDKANRSSDKSFRGPGLRQGLDWLGQIREKTGLPILTDIHDPTEAGLVAEVADILQIPAFLCRQTSLLEAVAKTNKIINIKKGQFLSPWDMKSVATKVANSGNKQILLTERGTSFGYNNLVVDFRAFPIMKEFGYPVVFDATHSVQLPGSKGDCSGGDRRFIAPLARAAVSAGVQGVFLECHPEPELALCDGPNSLRLADLTGLLTTLATLWDLNREW